MSLPLQARVIVVDKEPDALYDGCKGTITQMIQKGSTDEIDLYEVLLDKIEFNPKQQGNLAGTRIIWCWGSCRRSRFPNTR